jgi:hypothetical protein
MRSPLTVPTKRKCCLTPSSRAACPASLAKAKLVTKSHTLTNSKKGADVSVDVPANWKELAEAAIADLRAYALDETPERRLVSAEHYELIMRTLEAGGDPEFAVFWKNR